MKHLLISVAAATLLVACNNNKDNVEETAEKAGDAAVDSAQRALRDLGNITLRGGDAAEASEALAAMNLADSGAGRVTFGDVDKSDDGATFSNVTIEIPGEDGDDDDGATFVIGTMEFDGLDMVDGQASFSKLSLSDIQIEPHDPEDAANGSLEVANIELLNPSPALAAWVASLNGTGEPAPFPDIEEVSFDSWTLSDFAMEFMEDDGHGNFLIDSIQLGGVEDSKLGVAQISKLSFAGQSDDDDAFSMSLDNISLTGAALDILSAGFKEGFNSGMADDDELAASIMEQIYANPMEPGYDSFALENFLFEMGGVSFDLPSYDAVVNRNADGAVIGSETQPFTATLSADPEGGKSGGELAGALGMMGYETLVISGASKSSFDQEADTITFSADDNYLSLADGFSLRYGGDIKGITDYMETLQGMDFEAMGSNSSANEKLMQQALMNLEVNQFTLSLTDDSIIDRAINLYSVQSGEDPEMVRQQASFGVAMLPMLGAQAGIDPAILTDISTGLSSLLQNSGTLTVSLNPQAPLSAATFMEIEDPSTITKDMLGLTVTHEE